MQGLVEFLFGAGGRITRAKYWRSLLIFCGLGLRVGVILLAAAGLAAAHPDALAPALQYILTPTAFAFSIWGFVEIGRLRGTAGPNKYGSNPLSPHAARN